MTTTLTSSGFYVTGGTLRLDAPSYVERQADRDLLTALLKGEFCYVLTPRQMGKSSLMVRTASKLRERGAHVAVLDLTAIGQNLTPEQWYDGLLNRLGRQLKLEDKLEDYWQGHPRFGPAQRFFNALRDVAMLQRPGPLVLFVDEIDAVRSLPFSTDEFFAAVRECYNRRTEDAEFNRLTFCLLGVATPADLIRDIRTTPFNVGRRIELRDFTEAEAASLTRGLHCLGEIDDRPARERLSRILHWTGGHPYLTQRLCRAVCEAMENAPPDDGPTRSLDGIDRLCEELFLCQAARDRDDNLHFVRERVLRSEVDLAGLLDLYLKVRKGRRVVDDETNPLVSVLVLSGIVRGGDVLEVRNRIYHTVFDAEWVRKNTPDAELRRQREAFHKGLLRGGIIAAVGLVVLTIVGLWLTPQIKRLRGYRAIEAMTEQFRHVSSYRDATELRLEMKMPGMEATFHGFGSLAVARPNKLLLRFNLDMYLQRQRVHVIADGKKLWFWLPDALEYVVKDAPATYEAILAQEIPGDLLFGVESIYRLLLGDEPKGNPLRRVQQVEFNTNERFEGTQPAYSLRWRQAVPALTASTNAVGPTVPDRVIAIAAMIGKTTGRPLQITMDFSEVVSAGGGGSSPATTRRTPQRLVMTLVFRDLKLNELQSTDVFEFSPPANARWVENLEASRLRWNQRLLAAARAAPQRGTLDQRILPRDAAATPAQIDLKEFFNAALQDLWHPVALVEGLSTNDLTPRAAGLHTLAGQSFDVRGVVQLAGRQLDAAGGMFPSEIRGIKVGLPCRALHFLHGTAWNAPPGTPVANYVVRYTDGEVEAIPILYGRDLLDWWGPANEAPTASHSALAWTSSNAFHAGPDRAMRFCRTTWRNPRPDAEVASLDLISTQSDAAPFVLAITVE
jgi:outer membrane lipoprotein-sorting protein